VECNPIWDRMLGTCFILCILIGVPTNAVALGYFLTRKKKNLPNKLYISICCIDICTVLLIPFPIAISCFNNRYPVLFNNEIFCEASNDIFSYLHKISMFLVMLLSFTRCFAIAFPFRFQSVNKKKIFLAFPMYMLVLLVHLVFVTMKTSVVYSSTSLYCFYGNKNLSWTIINNILQGIEIGVPPFVCFISFLVCMIKLASSTPIESSGQQNKEAAVTVTMFTGIFLICNLPLFVNMVFVTITNVFYTYPGPLFSSKFMYWYSWPIFKYLFTVLNATLNPVLYYYRMAGMRRWTKYFVS